MTGVKLFSADKKRFVYNYNFVLTFIELHA